MHVLLSGMLFVLPHKLYCLFGCTAAAVYMVYCLILLVEQCPQQHLALGIAALSAGEKV
jgi:hypothetical protein